MAYYNSLNSLGENILENGDTIDFIGIKYTVTKNYLYNQNSTALNDQIFDKLDIKDKYTFCSSRYGYVVAIGIWPEYKSHDYSAATRLVKALFEIIEDKETVKASEKSEESKEIATSELFKEESKSSVLLPSKHRNIKQITIQREITLNKL